MEERRAGNDLHQLALASREKLQVDGVRNVGSFDREEVVLETEMGVLVIKGENLHMQHLNLDQGKIAVHGKIQSLVYTEEDLAQKGRGFLGKLFK